MDVLENEKLAENAQKMGELFRKELSSRINKKVALEVRGKGLMNAIVINASEFNIYQFT